MSVAGAARQPFAGAPAKSYLERLDEIVRTFPDRVAFRQKTREGYRQVSYAEAYRRARAVAAGLLDMGLGAGERVAIVSENRPEWVVSYLGILIAAGTVVPLDPQISPGEWRRLLDDCEARMVFASGLHGARLQEALEGSPLAEGVIRFDPAEDGARGLTLAELESRTAPAGGFPRAGFDDVVVIIYTSGTTGRPKGVMLTQANIVSDITAVLECVRADSSDAFLCLLPLQHVFASVVSFLLPLYLGATVVFADTLKRSEILEALEEAGISILATVPQFFYLFHDRIEEELRKKPAVVRRLFRALLRANRVAQRFGVNLGKTLFGKIHRNFGSRLRLFVSGGSAFDPKVAQDFCDLGFTILQGYGLTETTGACTVTRVEDNVIGSVGRPLPGVEIRIADPDDTGVGEVLIRGPVVMKGYYRNPQATAEVLRDGWFYSGDLGRLDERGNLFITGRKKEVIVLPNGKNIYPDEVEAHYQQSPYIQEIAVIGVSDPAGHRTSERLHAVVVPNFEYLKAKKIANAREILRDEIGRYSNQLPAYKRLMSYQIQKDPLPRTTTRKIKRLELRRMIEEGELRETEGAAGDGAASPEDRALLESPVGREVLRSLREQYGRTAPIGPGMNLELDLGFDSMERVELLASLETALGVELPDDFGAEIHTVRDLITRLDELTGARRAAGERARQSWTEILSESALSKEGEWQVRFSGPWLSALKYAGLRVFYLVFRILLGLEVRGLEHLPKEPPFLICPNHQSFLDPFVVMSVLPYRTFRKVFFVGYSEYFQNWLMKFLARLANIVPVDPDAHLLAAMKLGAWGLRQGRVLCIFPEGSRTYDGELLEFKKGAAILAREVGAPIVPVGLRGLHQVWPRDARRIRLHKVRVAFGPPLAPSREGEPAYDADTERLRAAVGRLI